MRVHKWGSVRVSVHTRRRRRRQPIDATERTERHRIDRSSAAVGGGLRAGQHSVEGEIGVGAGEAGWGLSGKEEKRAR